MWRTLIRLIANAVGVLSRPLHRRFRVERGRDSSTSWTLAGQRRSALAALVLGWGRAALSLANPFGNRHERHFRHELHHPSGRAQARRAVRAPHRANRGRARVDLASCRNQRIGAITRRAVPTELPRFREEGLGHVEILPPPALWDVTYWDHGQEHDVGDGPAGPCRDPSVERDGARSHAANGPGGRTDDLRRTRRSWADLHLVLRPR